MRICSIPGCTRKYEARGWCDTHYARWKRTGDALGLKVCERGEAINPQGYKVFGKVKEHIAVVEKAMGKKLPRGAVVHHVDENRLNNNPTNLVVCSRAYHMTIHARMRAQAACGNANWRICSICGQYDEPANLYVTPRGNSAYHNACRRAKHAAIKAGKEVPGTHIQTRKTLQIA